MIAPNKLHKLVLKNGFDIGIKYDSTITSTSSRYWHTKIAYWNTPLAEPHGTHHHLETGAVPYCKDHIMEIKEPRGVQPTVK